MQVYDERIWKIRTGFLMLSFGAWGAMLAVGDNLDAAKKGGPPLMVVTLSLAIAGLFVEVFYVVRKFRCIHVINRMGPGLHLLAQRKRTIQPEEVERWLRFSGDDERIPYHHALFGWAVVEGVIVYLLPVLGLFYACSVLSKS